MKKYVLVLMAVLFLGLPGGVRASDVAVPDVESRWFGIQWAVERVKHNFEVWVARTDEKKAELELRFMEKEEKLAEKITKLEEVNPKAAARLGKVAEKLKEKRVEKMEKVEMRIQKMEERGEGKVERLRERKEKILKRVQDDAPHQSVQDDAPHQSVQDDDEMMEGRGVKIQNAKPGVVRMR